MFSFRRSAFPDNEDEAFRNHYTVLTCSLGDDRIVSFTVERVVLSQVKRA